MPGFGLIHLGFLAATAAVAVPILIHLLLKPRARRMEIGTLRFLKLVLRDSTRRRKLRRWLLFALRCAAILLLALLFARPYFSMAGIEGRDREVVLLIDQSASMGVTYDERTLFSRAQEAAEKILKNQPEGTATHLAYFDALGVAASQEMRIYHTREAGFAGTDYGLALGWARDLVVSSKRPQRKIYLFTDLQRSGLRGKPFEGMPGDVELEISAFGKAVAANLAVESVESSEPLLRAGQPIAVTANLFNSGPIAARDVAVRLSLASDAGKLADMIKKITIAPGARQTVEFSTAIVKPGLYRGYVEIVTEDDFPLDNRRWLAIDARPPDRVLLVDGEPAASVYGNETYYLEAALRLRLPRKGGSITPYEPERLAWGGETKLPDLRAYRLVVLCNVASVTEADLLRLRTFVAEGGSLLIFTGKNVQTAGYEAFEKAGLLPASIDGVAGPDYFRFAEWEKNHPILRPFADPQNGDLHRLNFLRITKLKPLTGAKVLAATQNKDPLLVESHLERGTILLFASTVDRDWSNWPQTRLYVPLIHQLVGYLTERLPENERVQQAPAGPGRENPPGIHEAAGRVAVRNLTAEESDLERVSEEVFRQTYHLADLSASVNKARAAAALKTPADNERPDELWVYVVWALLLVLVAELFVANRTYA